MGRAPPAQPSNDRRALVVVDGTSGFELEQLAKGGTGQRIDHLGGLVRIVRAADLQTFIAVELAQAIDDLYHLSPSQTEHTEAKMLDARVPPHAEAHCCPTTRVIGSADEQCAVDLAEKERRVEVRKLLG